MRLRFNSEEAETQQLEYAMKMQEQHERMQEEAAMQAEQSASKSIASEVSSEMPLESAPQIQSNSVEPSYERQEDLEVSY
jgi:hypothetical protein